MLDVLLDLVLPARCVGCGAPPMTLCPRCGPGDQPRHVPCGGLDVVAVADYAAGLRRALIAYKERGRRDLARPLGALLGLGIRGAITADGLGPRDAVLVSIPSARAVAAARGGDHVRRLARRAAPISGVPVAPGVLRPTRVIHDSAGLTIAQRSANLQGALRARPPGGRAAIVVDDIVTTGATLREAQRALTCAGWSVAGAVVVAATPRRVQPHPLATSR